MGIRDYACINTMGALPEKVLAGRLRGSSLTWRSIIGAQPITIRGSIEDQVSSSNCGRVVLYPALA